MSDQIQCAARRAYELEETPGLLVYRVGVLWPDGMRRELFFEFDEEAFKSGIGTGETKLSREAMLLQMVATAFERILTEHEKKRKRIDMDQWLKKR